MATTQLPTNARDITAGHVAQALRATGHDAQVEYQGHGMIYVVVPLPTGDRILVHSYGGFHTDPAAGTIDTDDGWPGAIIEAADGTVSEDDDDAVFLDGDAPDVGQMFDSVTVADLLSFTVAAVVQLKGRR